MGKKKLDNLTTGAFELFCACQLTETEISDALGVCEDTLNAWVKRNYKGKTFSEVYAEKRTKGKLSVRSAGFKMAQTNPTMNIFWTKCLGMSEDPAQEKRRQEKHEIELEQMHIELARKELELEKLRLEVEALKNSGDNDEIDL